MFLNWMRYNIIKDYVKIKILIIKIKLKIVYNRINIVIYILYFVLRYL